MCVFCPLDSRSVVSVVAVVLDCETFKSMKTALRYVPLLRLPGRLSLRVWSF